MPTELQPGRDLWPEIAARIQMPAQASGAALHWWQSPVFVAASLMVAASALTYALTRPDTQGLPASAGQAMPAYDLEAGFLAQRGRLESQLEGHIASLSPEMQELVRTNLAAIRSSMREISMALSNDPANPDLQDLMLSTYEQELQVMTELTKIPANDARRIDL